MLNILYVEDDAPSRNVVRMAQRLNPGTFVLTCFEDSQDFEGRLIDLEPQPDLILLDIHMKPFSGFEMLKFIRRHPEYDATPVVALTASVMNEEVEMLQTAGFHSVLSKPLNLDAFDDMLQRIMNGEQIWIVW
ncbi:MAG: response regulator [Chloroflexi bacterium]|nr:response regulator [Chloroflexota bacterium]